MYRDGDRAAGHERIVVHLPMRLTTVTRVLGALAAEFPEGRWVDDPGGHLAIEVPVADPDDPAMERVRIDDVPAEGGSR
jgi:hypothetical protein